MPAGILYISTLAQWLLPVEETGMDDVAEGALLGDYFPAGRQLTKATFVLKRKQPVADAEYIFRKDLFITPSPLLPSGIFGLVGEN